MQPPAQPIKMVPVDADTFESVAYVSSTRRLYIKFPNAPVVCYEKVPGFRYQGLISAPRKDAYFKTFIQNQFLSKSVEAPL